MKIPESVMSQYMKDVAEHAKMIRADQYYAHCHGGGIVPEPKCIACSHYDGFRYCLLCVNNGDISNVMNPEEFEVDENGICEDYAWDGELEERS